MAAAVGTDGLISERPASPASRLVARLWEPVDAASLIAFRFILGSLLVIAVVRQWAKGAIYDQFVVPKHFFPYDGLSFITPLRGDGMYYVYVALALAGVFLALGIQRRVAAATACVLFTYCHFCDKTNYLNHYYLVSLLLGLTAALPLENGRATVPRWMLWLIRFQIGLVYFYGGVGKLESDWLVRAMPLQIWLAGNGDFPVLGPVLRIRETAWIMSWLGATFDLSAPFLLSLRKTRIYAYAVVITFHVITSRLFQIGMFPWVMIAITLVFFEPSWPRRWFGGWLNRLERRLATRGPLPATPRWALPVAAAWAIFQFLYPLRGHLYPGNILWTEDAYRFSWRVMLIEKAGSADFTVTDPASGAHWEIRVRDWLTPLQVKMMSTQPDMIRAFAWMIADDAEAHGQPRPRVTADVFVSLNGRPPARLVDPNVDLAAEPIRLGGTPWVLPLPP